MILKILHIGLFLFACPQIEGNSNNTIIHIENIGERVAYIQLDSASIKSGKKVKLTVYRNCYLLESNVYELDSAKKRISIKIDSGCNYIEVGLRTLIGYNDIIRLSDGDTLQISQENQSPTYLIRGRSYWDTNFFYEVNKESVGTNLFYTKSIFKNNGKPPKSTSLLIQMNSEKRQVDSLEMIGEMSKINSLYLKEAIALHTLGCLIRLKEDTLYTRLKNEFIILKGGNSMIHSALYKIWLLQDLLTYKMGLNNEQWETSVSHPIFDTINKYYAGIDNDFLTFYAYTELLPIEALQKENAFTSSVYSNFFDTIIEQKLVTTKLEKDALVTGLGKNITVDSIFSFNAFSYVDFWASWCAPCRAEMPASKKLQQQFKDAPIQFVYISTDEKPNAWLTAIEIEGLKQYPLSYLLARPKDASIIKQLTITSIPRYVIFDKNGKIIHANAPRPSDPKLIPLLEKLLSAAK